MTQPQPATSKRTLAENMRHNGCDECRAGAVQPGQVFEDKDARPAGRRLRVLTVHPRVIHSPAYARVVNVATGRESGIKLSRLVRDFWYLGYDRG